MRISKVSVEGLFRQYDHVVPLNQKERITIIRGRNGVGKTALLRMVNGLFQPNLAVYRTTAFKSLRVDLDDGRALTVIGGKPAGGLLTRAFLRASAPIGGNQDEGGVTVVGPENSQRWDSNGWGGTVEENAPFIEEIGRKLPGLIARPNDNLWWDAFDDEELRLQDVYDKYGSCLTTPPVWTPAWLGEFQGKGLTSLVKIDRVEPMETVTGPRAQHSASPAATPVEPLERYSRFIQAAIEEVRNAVLVARTSGEPSSENRLMDGMPEGDRPAPAAERLRQKAGELQKRRRKLLDAGLLDRTHDVDIPLESDLPAAARRELDARLDVAADLLARYEALGAKISLFKKIIDSALDDSGRRLASNWTRELRFERPIDESEWGTVWREDHRTLPPDERQYLFFFLSLLFHIGIRPGALVLLDEPERNMPLTWHATWQRKFLNDLADVARLADLDLLIATHSPVIIGGRPDLVIELK